ncbi:hypothetical protein HELRODRAFT_168229 [Helobdella robusta]|uniref:Lactate/malate dehydrogenase C-terminal domain-containing protein n=1 Tax=Helobdella robusta TaxID=6412 RepID=T1F0C2_HELRO|nr:hypothetical protein HELRODRAFT_168229 [Helobdella robusta]ESO09268.1 hypothetical protein HELRODRAFT_168229 [Helobdella robusta]
MSDDRYEGDDWRAERVKDIQKTCDKFLAQTNFLVSATDDGDSKSAVKILITGAASNQKNIFLLHSIAEGQMLGPTQNVILICYGDQKASIILQEMVNELKDCFLPLLADVLVTTDEKEAFTGIKIALLLDSVANDERSSLGKYQDTFRMMKEYGHSFNYTGSNVKILVISEPVLINALILRRHCQAVPPKNIASLSLTPLNVTKYQLFYDSSSFKVAKKMDAQPDRIKNLIMWGDDPHTFTYDLSRSTFKEGSEWKHLPTVLANEHWVKNYLPELVKERIQKLASRTESSLIVLSRAVCEQVYSWWFGLPNNDIKRMGVESDGSYGITKGLYADFPVTINSNGEYNIVRDIEITPTHQLKIQAINERLLDYVHSIQDWPMFQQNQLLA